MMPAPLTARRILAALLAPLAIAAALGPADALGQRQRRGRSLTDAEVRARNAARITAIAAVPGEPRWRWIVLHHTAAERDSLASISRYHAARFADPLGIEYHFLIGNGHSAGDGEVQVARWAHRVQSIHVAHPERAPTAITVTAQANLHLRAPSGAQMLAIEQLLRKLMALYQIPAHRVSSNTRVDGTVTVCPGRYFPFDRLVWRLRQLEPPTSADWRDPLAPAPLEGPLADLEAVRAALVWDVPCRERIPIGAWQPLGALQAGQLQARLLHIDGGRGCTPIQRRFLAIHTGDGWYFRELNGYRAPRLVALRRPRSKRADADALRFDVRDERGVMQRCLATGTAPPTCRLPRPGER